MKTPQYEQILKELDEGQRIAIAHRLFDLLKSHPAGLDRRQLVLLVFGQPARPNINNDTRDRKIRETISAMRARFIPIISTSGEAGYRLDDSEQARESMLAELIKRRDSINAQIEAASAAWQIPVTLFDDSAAQQGRLL